MLEMATMKDLDSIFNQEIVPHFDALYNFIFSLTRNEDDANDVMQDTLLRAFRALGNYQQGTNAKAWLFTIAKNAYINEYRRRAKAAIPTDFNAFTNVQEEDDSSYLSSYGDFRIEMFDKMMGDEVTDAINAIPDIFRVPILLCDVEDFSYEEISAITGVKLNTVRTRIHRGRGLLRDLLMGYAIKRGYVSPQKDAEEPKSEE